MTTSEPVRVPTAKVGLATASVYPESTANAFEIAARLGYDGVEVMVWTDPVSQDVTALRRLSDYHQIPILALHAPCLVMFPLRARGREVVPYAPDWDPTGEDFPDFTLDLSHTSVSQSDALAMAADMGDRLSHVHIADGNGTARDEHLVPGRGNQPCADLLEGLAEQAFEGLVVVEVNTRKCEDRAERETDLAEALAFTRLNLAAPVEADTSAFRR